MDTLNEIKILIADDHSIFRNGLKYLFTSFAPNNMTIVAEAGNGAEAVKKVQELLPDIVLMDIQMPVMNGIQATSVITKNYRSVKVIALSTFNENSFVLSMFNAGARGFILKNTNADELFLAVRSVHNGESYITSDASDQLIKKIRFENRQLKVWEELTEREIEIVHLICDGYCNKEIAGKLHLSRRTIESYRQRIMEKIGVKNSFELFSYAVQRGIHGMIYPSVASI